MCLYVYCTIGSVYYYFQVTGKWSRQSKLTAEDGEMDDSFGRSVGIYGAEALVGAYFDDDKDMDSGTHPTI
jgi:hypothetical protein